MKLKNPFSSYRVNDSDDFIVKWDVEEYGKKGSDAILSAACTIKENPNPTGERKIIVLAGSSGYGKSHLFGRVKQKMRDKAYCAYVPMTSDPEQVTFSDHIRWKLVESLFVNKNDFAPIRLLMAELLQKSFLAFFDQLPDQTKVKANSIWQELGQHPKNVLALFSNIYELVPYFKLAQSIHDQNRDLSFGVLQACVLSLSPSSRDAQTWLWGEEDCLSFERRQELLLTDHPPSAREIIRVIAALFQKIGKTFVLCFDQLEFFLQGPVEYANRLTSELMSWLQDIPNVLIVVGCFRETWTRFIESDSMQSFRRRTDLIHLTHLEPEQAVELVKRRMDCWEGRLPEQDAGWPFDLVSLRKFAQEEALNPGALLNICKSRFDEWLEQGSHNKISIFNASPAASPQALFIEEWNSRLEKIRFNKKSIEDYPESEIFEAFQNAIEISGLFEKLGPALTSSKTTKYFSCRIRNLKEPNTPEWIVTFSKKDGGSAFSSWVNAIDSALETHSSSNGITIWPRENLSVKSGKGLTRYNQLRGIRIFPFAIDKHPTDFETVICLREAIKDAKTEQFLLIGKAISTEKLLDFIRECKILEGLKFIQFILKNKHSNMQSSANEKDIPLSDSTRPFVKKDDPLLPNCPKDILKEQLNNLVQFLIKKKQHVTEDGYEVGPTFIRFRVKLTADADVSKIKKQAENLQNYLSVDREPIIENHGGYVSIDVQRPDRQTVSLAPLINNRPVELGKAAFPAGVDVAGNTKWLDLSDAATCHCLVAGITGSGKSEFLKSILASMASSMSPKEVQFALIDPKRVTFHLTGPSPYLMQPIVYQAEETIPLLQHCCEEMTSRYSLLKKYGKSKLEDLPDAIRPARWIIVADEFANLMDDKVLKSQLESKLKSLASMARAAGIHLILATQRPEASVVTTLLRSNLPCRIGFQVATGRDSKIILDNVGAEQLLGKGDFLLRLNAGMQRLQSPFVSAIEFETYLQVRPTTSEILSTDFGFKVGNS